MRRSTIRPKGAAGFATSKPACQVLILHEDFSAYGRAVEVCRRLMERFGSDLDFDIKCWNFIELADPNCARHAAKTAGAADIILLSMHTAELPASVEKWLDDSFGARFTAEGVLALVISGAAGPPAGFEQLTLRLRDLATRLGMDFISLLPGSPSPNQSPELDGAATAAPAPL
jgi:hypothetical protein